jgi:hypothetical protein
MRVYIRIIHTCIHIYKPETLIYIYIYISYACAHLGANMHKRVPTSRRKRRRRSLSSSSSYKLYSSSSSSYKLYSSSSSSYKLRSHFPTLTDIHPSVSSPAPHPALFPSLPFAVAPPPWGKLWQPRNLDFFFLFSLWDRL